MKTRMNIGISSLILIFIVLCLVTFGLLSLSSGKNDLVLAERNGAAVREFYRADSEAERFIAMADEKLKAVLLKKESMEAGVSAKQLKEALGDYYDEASGMVRTDIPMDKGQALHIELALEEAKGKKTGFRVREYYVYNQEDYEIDQSMPVWTGQ